MTNSTVKEIEWAKKAAEVINSKYESFIHENGKCSVRIYLPEGINTWTLNKIKRMIPWGFEFWGIFYCKKEQMTYLSIWEN